MDDLNLIDLDDARIDLYLNNRMDEFERAAFELAMMEDPALLQRVQLLDTFKQGLSCESATLTSGEADGMSRFAANPGLRAWIRQPLSLAASVLVAGLGIQLLASGLFSSHVLPLQSVVVLENIRGAGSIAFSGAGPYLFQVDAGLGTGAEGYGLSLRNVATGALLIAERDLRADGNGWVRVALDEELQGDFSVELAWQDAEGNTRTREYRLTVNRN